jgi:hypothetical protein
MVGEGKDCFRGVRRRTVVSVGLVVVAGLSVVSPALAGGPQGIFSAFSDCPTNVPIVVLCQDGTINSGEIVIGSTRVPISRPMTLQDGAIATGVLNQYYLFPAKDGNSLSKTEESVPGGLVDCSQIRGHGFLKLILRLTCRAIFENRNSRVTAVTELVANEKDPAVLDLLSFAFEENTAMVLPVRIHLKNRLLSENCYIGSETSPILLHLTTGTTKPEPPNSPIKGKAGTLSEEEENGHAVTIAQESTLLDNTFSVPKAEGCGTGPAASLIDSLINTKLGLPSPNGHNTIILNTTIKTAEASSVTASEKF